jgi:hypothetical protein
MYPVAKSYPPASQMYQPMVGTSSQGPQPYSRIIGCYYQKTELYPQGDKPHAQRPRLFPQESQLYPPAGTEAYTQGSQPTAQDTQIYAPGDQLYSRRPRSFIQGIQPFYVLAQLGMPSSRPPHSMAPTDLSATLPYYSAPQRGLSVSQTSYSGGQSRNLVTQNPSLTSPTSINDENTQPYHSSFPARRDSLRGSAEDVVGLGGKGYKIKAKDAKVSSLNKSIATSDVQCDTADSFQIIKYDKIPGNSSLLARYNSLMSAFTIQSLM